MSRSPFHAGERAVQTRAGVREMAERGGRAMVRSAMPEQHRELFEELPYVIVATLDGDDFPRASMLVGVPGFVHAPDERTLVIDSAPSNGDPILAGLRPGAPIGLLGIQLETRRRNRANGTIRAIDDAGITVAVDESFGNCPQYIQTRAPLTAIRRPTTGSAAEGATLSKRARTLIQAADTLFLASASLGDGDGPKKVDVSHRGGKPGFVRIDDAPDRTVLVLPDFSGNNLFMTLGNLEENPRAGIAIVDFASGALLSLFGTTETIWDGAELAAFTGAQRLVRFRVAGGALLEGAIPFTWSEAGYARQLARTGAW